MDHCSGFAPLLCCDESKNLERTDSTWDGRARETCPACSASGFVGGTLWDEETVDTEDAWYGTDDFPYHDVTETVRRTFTLEDFDCPVCGLHLYGTKEIAAAGLDDQFCTEETRELEFEPDYGNE